MTHKKKNSVETAVLADSATQPVRQYPEEAYSFELEDSGYTLEDLLAQLPKSETPESNAVAKGCATQPVREYPEEAYDFEFEDPGYTLEDLLAQLPKSETPASNADAETAVAKGYATQPVREYPEEAYCFSAEELEQSLDSEQVKAPSPAKRTRTEEPRIRVRKPDYTLEDLLAQVTEDNRHEVVDFGPPVGKEVW